MLSGVTKDQRININRGVKGNLTAIVPMPRRVTLALRQLDNYLRYGVFFVVSETLSASNSKYLAFEVFTVKCLNTSDSCLDPGLIV